MASNSWTVIQGMGWEGEKEFKRDQRLHGSRLRISRSSQGTQRQGEQGCPPSNVLPSSDYFLPSELCGGSWQTDLSCIKNAGGAKRDLTLLHSPTLPTQAQFPMAHQTMRDPSWNRAGELMILWRRSLGSDVSQPGPELLVGGGRVKEEGQWATWQLTRCGDLGTGSHWEGPTWPSHTAHTMGLGILLSHEQKSKEKTVTRIWITCSGSSPSTETPFTSTSLSPAYSNPK
jgi:hypothetical protein